MVVGKQEDIREAFAYQKGQIATLTKEVQAANLRLAEFIEGVDALKTRLEAAEKERGGMATVLRRIGDVSASCAKCSYMKQMAYQAFADHIKVQQRQGKEGAADSG